MTDNSLFHNASVCALIVSILLAPISLSRFIRACSTLIKDVPTMALITSFFPVLKRIYPPILVDDSKCRLPVRRDVDDFLSGLIQLSFIREPPFMLIIFQFYIIHFTGFQRNLLLGRLIAETMRFPVIDEQFSVDI